MQPYFIPYAGYFRLLAATDLFVIYDCVQFTRRGYVHRNQLPNSSGELAWLTLPLAKAPQDIKIAELAFPEDAEVRMQEQLNKFPLFRGKRFLESELNTLRNSFSLSPTAYITNSLKLICQVLDIPFNVAFSSELNLPAELKGQERIIATAKHFNASTYINSPGGKSLYNVDDFKKHNIDLKFLSDYQGGYQSVLPRIFSEDISDIRNEIISQSVVV